MTASTSEAAPASTEPAVQAEPAPVSAPASPPGTRRAKKPRGEASWGPAQAVGLGVSALALLLVGFLGFLLVGSGIAERRSQDTLYETFRGQLNQAVAPVGPTSSGRAVAIIEIPALGLRDVVVEGTTSGDMARGPGHRRDTVLPGQAGVSIVLGRRATYGKPFAKILSLSPGDIITTTTGLGTARYKVTDIRDAAAKFSVIPGATRNQLILETSDAPLVPTHSVLVVSTLISKPQPGPAGLPTIRGAEKPLHGDGTAALTLAWWSQALLIVVVLSTIAWFRWSRPALYLLASPLFIAVVWNVFESLGRLLPNTL
jgi:sortase A